MRRSAWTAALAVSTLVTTATLASTALAEEWHLVAQNASHAYIAEVSNLPVSEGVTTISVARTPRTRTNAENYSHRIRRMDVRCSSNEIHLVETIEFGPDGAETDRFAETEPWETAVRNSLDATLKAFACEGTRSTGSTFESIRAFMDQGR